MTTTPSAPPTTRPGPPSHGGAHGHGGAPNPHRHAVSRPAQDPSAVRRTLYALGASALAALPLKGLITDYGWLIDVWITMAIVIGPALLLRRRRPPGALDVWPGVVLAVPWLTARFAPDHALGGLIPTTGTWHDLGLLMTDLHNTTRDEVAPVHSTVAIKLVLCALLGLLAALIDLIAVVGRRGALAGVPLLVVYTVSGAVPREPVSWVWFVAAAVGFLLLLAVNADDELRRWGRRIGRPGSSRAPVPVPVSAPRIGAAAIAVAIVVPLVVPDQAHNLIADAFHHHGSGSGSGSGSGTGINPFASLKGQLQRDRPSDVLKVKLNSPVPDRPPFYLRSNVLDEFTGSGWRVSDHGDSQDLGGSYATEPPTPGSRTVRYSASITPATSGGNLPVFAVPTRLTGARSGVQWNPQDQLLLGDDARQDETYREEFDEVSPTTADLRAATADYPADMSRWLSLPSVPRQVTSLVERLTSGATTPYAKARALTDYFAEPGNGFRYSLKTKIGDSRNDLVNFLETKVGYCQQYAAATAVMLRLAGVPSRVVLGYMHPVANAQGEFTVTSFDAHAWVESYFSGIGWVPFDTTPIDGLDGGSRADRSYAPHQYPSNANDPGVTKSRTAQSTTSAAAPSTTAASSSAAAPVAASRPADHTPLWVSLGVLVAVLLALTPGAARLLRRRRRLSAARFGDPDPLWAELSDTAVDLGYVWSPSRSPRQVAGWLGRDTGDPGALHALAQAVEQHRYGPQVSAQDTDDLSRGLARATAQLRARRSNSVRLRARLWPASLGLGWDTLWRRGPLGTLGAHGSGRSSRMGGKRRR